MEGTPPRDARSLADQQHGAPVSTAELQQSLQRSTGEFLDTLTQAADVFNDPRQPETQQIALRRVLRYGSSALDIATGPLPEVNVLDMVVFLALNRHVLETYWVPVKLGPKAQPLVSVFANSERSAWALAGRILSAQQLQQLSDLIQAWQRQHPDQVQVEWVRFQDFAVRAEVVEKERASEAQGMLGSVKSMSQSTERAVLLAERGLFLANRMPFLLRLQARLGADETVADTMGRLEGLQNLAAFPTNLRPVLHDAVELSNSSRATMQEMRLLYQSFEPALQSLEIVPSEKEKPVNAQTTSATYRDLAALLQTSNQLAERSLELTHELRQLTGPESAEPVRQLGARIDGWLQRAFAYLLLVGAAWTVLFWGGYYLAKRGTARAAAADGGSVRASPRRRSEHHSQPPSHAGHKP